MSELEQRKAVTFRASPVEIEQIERAAASEGLATASYVRRVALLAARLAVRESEKRHAA